MKRVACALGVTAIVAGSAMGADPAKIDWDKIPAKTVTLFYPGQSSYQWLNSDHKGGKGADAVKKGQACLRCHEDEEKKLGEALVKGGKLEPPRSRARTAGWI
jgi:hypothetical protein